MELLYLLRCPETRSRLQPARRQLIVALNEAIARRRLHDRLGRLVTRRLENVLINEDESFAYPVFDEIINLLADEAIPLDQLTDVRTPRE